MYRKLSTEDIQGLVVRMIDGDEYAFCQLYVEFKEPLQLFALRFLKVKEYSEDVIQDVFVNIWLGRRLINPEIPFSSYLYTIAKNRVLNFLRDMEKRSMLEEHLFLQAADYSDETQDEILTDDLRNILDKAFSTMTPRQREIFRLSRELHLSYKEIADKLNISVNTVHEHIKSSLRIIRSFLIKYSDARIDLVLVLISLNV